MLCTLKGRWRFWITKICMRESKTNRERQRALDALPFMGLQFCQIDTHSLLYVTGFSDNTVVNQHDFYQQRGIWSKPVLLYCTIRDSLLCLHIRSDLLKDDFHYKCFHTLFLSVQVIFLHALFSFSLILHVLLHNLNVLVSNCSWVTLTLGS